MAAWMSMSGLTVVLMALQVWLLWRLVCFSLLKVVKGSLRDGVTLKLCFRSLPAFVSSIFWLVCGCSGRDGWMALLVVQLVWPSVDVVQWVGDGRMEKSPDQGWEWYGGDKKKEKKRKKLDEPLIFCSFVAWFLQQKNVEITREN